MKSTPRRRAAKLAGLSDELHIIRRAVEGAMRLSQSAEGEPDHTARVIHREVSAILTLVTERIAAVDRSIRDDELRDKR